MPTPDMLYELINPSDPYTFRAPSVEVAGAAVALLSSSFGAVPVGGGERTPVLFGWKAWLAERGIDDDWIAAHRVEIADALDSLLIGHPGERVDLETLLAALPDGEAREQWRDERQRRRRTSLNEIGEYAYKLAAKLRELHQEEGQHANA